MKVKVLSDLHLEFSMMDPGHGDVLVLAGDICVASNYEEYADFFDLCVENYNQVFYVLGNHEHYNGRWNEAFWILQDKLPEGITLLNNKSVYYQGVHFIGATMWTNFDNMNQLEMDEAGRYMNDYHAVEGNEPANTLEEHLFSRDWFERAIPTLRGPVFVITHHAPSYQSVQGRYIDSKHCYASDLERLIMKNPNIVAWAHGHIHHSNDYQIGECRVISNPRGYVPGEPNPNFDPDMGLTLEPEKVIV